MVLNKPIFEDSSHTYTNSVEGYLYTSVTNLVAKYKEPFNKDYWSLYNSGRRLLNLSDSEEDKSKYSNLLTRNGLNWTSKTIDNLMFSLALILTDNDFKKLKETQKIELQNWGINNKRATTAGTKLHNFKEDSLKAAGFDLDIFGLDASVIIEEFITDNLFDLPDGVYTELMVWNNKYKVAGLSDKVTIDTIGNKRFIDIDDYKTYKRVDTTSYLNKRTGEYKKMLHPVNKLMDCNFIHTSLQLSLYAYFLEYFGFTVRNIKFTHIPLSEDKTQVLDIIGIPYYCKYLREEVINILQHHKNRSN